MSNSQTSSANDMSTQEKILANVDPGDFAWAVPIMRAGYAGRGLVYLVVAGISLWSILRGGQAEGTKSAMQSLDGTLGVIVVVAIAVGMFAYAIWRMVDSFWDLEAYGSDAKGVVARGGMLVTGLIHGAIGVIAITILGFASSGSSSKQMLNEFLKTTTGVWVVGLVGVATMGTGIYYFYKAKSQSYREKLEANHFTLHWNPVLRAGVAAQGMVVLIIGGLIVYAALSTNASEAGGIGSAFDWLHKQAYGRVLVAALCSGLMGFSLFCFVNAGYRIVPKAADDSVQSLARKIKQMAS
ncbi:DUF1206 domain-containing protein [Roseobacter sp. GAI101]|uniref:DUF1206 domain-containing protein n=1 Tax=Roseobacter sp. (strain GAI101) TaxID=391589 RepID=UPI0003231331|nr:DUF1206 domain-containing protein [Roseobacter sp. GAI101]